MDARYKNKNVLKVVDDFKRTLWVLGAFSAVFNTLMLVQPIYMLQVYDRVLPSRSIETLLFLSLVIGVALALLALLEVVRTIISTRAAARFDIELSDLAMKTIIRNGSSAGGGVQPLRDIASLRTLIASKALLAILDLPFGVIFVVIMYFIHPALFWLTLSGAGILTLVAVFNQQALAKVSKEQGDLGMTASTRSEHLARNADSIIAMGMVNNTVDGWGAVHGNSLGAADRAGTINAWFAGLSKFLRLGLQTAILGYGAFLVLEGQMTAGMIFASSLISARALQPIDQIIASWRQLAQGQEAWRRLHSFMDSADRRTSYTELPPPEGLIEVSDLTQPNPADPARQPILQRINFRIEPGEVVAILGPSGSGKTTLARMLVGAVSPRMGKIRIGGHDIANRDPEEIGKHIGYLAQDVELLPGTIAENISRFDPSASGDAIVAAARAAHAEDLIRALPRGYDTVIGPGGLQLSGGEKQRVGLARAIYGRPRILVLDEPNSNLDRNGEAALVRAIGDARRNGVTVVVVTQRESILSHVDKIMRINNGIVIEFGERDAVLARNRVVMPQVPVPARSSA